MEAIPQGGSTSVWAAVVAPADEIGGDMREHATWANTVPDDATITASVKVYVDMRSTQKMPRPLWKKSEEFGGRGLSSSLHCQTVSCKYVQSRTGRNDRTD